MVAGLYFDSDMEVENYIYSDPPPTFVSFSTDRNGDVMVRLRQEHNVSLQEFSDIRLNSVQFANLLFQMKALERQFMETELVTNNNAISINWNEFLPPQQPLVPFPTTTSTDNAEVQPKSVKRKRKKEPTATTAETIIIDGGDTPILDLTKDL